MQAAGCGWGMEAPEVVTTPRRGGGGRYPNPATGNTENSAETFLGRVARAHQQ